MFNFGVPKINIRSTCSVVFVLTAISKKTVAAKVRTDRLDLRVLKAKSSAMYANDHRRFLQMTWVKCHIIEGFCPLSHGEKDLVRACLRLTAVKDFDVTGIHNKAVKHMVTEFYAATASQFKKEMAAEVGGVPLLHLNLDLWVDKFSSLTYIGKNTRVIAVAPSKLHVTVRSVAEPPPPYRAVSFVLSH